jgi:glycosyltransferase involved in cell wall biosynthesis
MMPVVSSLALLGPGPPDRGGIAQQTMLLADALGPRLAGYFTYSRGYPRLINPRRFDAAPELMEAARKVTPALDWARPDSWKQTARKIVDTGAAAVVAPWWTAFWALPLRGVFRETRRHNTRFRNVILCHHVFDHESAAWKKWLTWRAFAAADAVIAQSDGDRDTIARRFREIPIRVLPHPVEARPLADRDAAREKFGIGGRPLVLFLGLIRPYKGLDVLFDAAPRIVEETGAAVAIVGEVFPDSRAEIARRMRLPIASRIRLVDRYVTENEMDEWLAACDVVVCPYRKNSGSGIAARAIAARRPVVASDQSGFRPFVSEATGALVPEDDPERLSEAVVSVLRRGVESYATGLTAVAAAHSWSAYGGQVERFAAEIGAS